MPSTNYAFVNGRFVPEAQAAVGIFDRGFLYGEGCFETLRIYSGRLFQALEHFDRLLAGLAVLEIEPPFSPHEIRGICRALIRRNDLRDGIARVYCTRDSIVVTAQSKEFVPREFTAIISRVTVNGWLSRHKTANRLPYLMARREADRAGADEAVLLNQDGSLVEFCTGNLFVVKRGELFTPPLADGPLPGITRRVVIELARAANVPVYELSLPPTFLEQADEVFATNSLIEIAPVTTWSRERAVTRRLQVAYRERVEQQLDTPAP
jgi:branched-chain amino acid aminotransferase